MIVRNYINIVFVLLALVVLIVQAFDPDTSIEWQSCSRLDSIIKSNKFTSTMSINHSNNIMIAGGGSSRRINTVYASENGKNVVQCAAIHVPLLWDESNDDRSVRFYVRRVRCGDKVTTRTGQLWILNGEKGPLSGSSLYTWAESLCQDLPGYDIMIPDHRGIGLSTVLAKECSKLKKKTFVDCYDYVQGLYNTGSLKGFGTTAAARDVLHFAQLAKAGLGSDSVVAVYGVNYGTYWLHRMLQISPQEIDMVIADSAFSVLKSQVEASAIDLRYNETGTELIENCKADSTCIGRFFNLTGTTNLEQIIMNVMNKQDTQQACHGDHWKSSKVQRFSSSRLRKLYAGMLTETPLSKLILPSIYRLHRCSSADKKWLQNFGYKLSRTIGTFGTTMKARFYSPSNNTSVEEVLYGVIATSELSSDPIPHDSDYWKSLYTNIPPFFMRQESEITTQKLRIVTPYSDDLANEWAVYNKSMLIMHATLSPIAPKSFGESWINTYGSLPGVQVAVFPHALGGIAQNTPMKDSKDSRIAGKVVLLDFIKSEGSGTVNNTLISLWTHYNYNFASSSKWKDYVGYENLWESGPAKTFEKTAQLKIAKNLGIGCGVLVLVSIVFVVLAIVDGTICMYWSNKESKKYMAMNN